MSLKERVMWGMCASMGGFLVKTLLNLSVIPMMIAQMGAASYGVYTLMLVIIDILSDLANGVINALTLQLGQTFKPDTMAHHLQLLRTGLWVHVAMAVVMFGLGMASMPLLLNAIQWPANMASAVPLMFCLALLEGCVLMSTGFYRSCLAVHTRLATAHTIDMAQAVVSNLLTVILLLLNMPLPVLMASRLGVAILTALILIGLTRHEWQIQKHWQPWLVSKADWQSFWQVAGVTTTSAIMLLLSTRTDSLIIGSLLPVTLVAVYGITQRLFGQALFLSLRIASVAFPVMNRLLTEGQDAVVSRFFLRLSNALCFMVSILCLWLVWFFPILFQTLSHGQLALADAWPVVWVLVPYAIIHVTAAPITSYLDSKNEYRLIRRWIWQSALINLALTVVLVPLVGIAGAAAGTLVANIIEKLWRGTPKACQLQGIKPGHYFAQVYGKNALPFWVAIGILWISSMLLAPLPQWLTMVACGLLMAVTSGMTWAWLNLTPTEWLTLRQRVTMRQVLQR